MRSGLLIATLVLLCPDNSGAQEAQALVFSGTQLNVPAALVPPPGEPVKCGFPIIAHQLRQGAVLKNGRRESAVSVLSRPVTQKAVTRGTFCVHYDTSGINTPALVGENGVRIDASAGAYVDSIFSILSFVYPYETATLQYPGPPADDTLGGGPECDIYVQELGSMYGYTTPDRPVVEGGTSPSYITIDNDFAFVNPASNKGLPALRVTIAHEFHHVIQVGNYGYWFDDPFYYEITSTWMEDVVFPDVNDYFNYTGAAWGHYRNPETPFTSNELIMYSRATWGHYVARRFGTDVMRETWEQIRQARPQTAIDRALRARGSDLGTAYAEWSVWNYFTGFRAKPATYFPDGASYPPVAQSSIDFTGTSRDISGSLQSLAARYYSIQTGADTMSVIVSNTDLSGTLLESNPYVHYTLRLRNTRTDGSYMQTPIGIYGKLDVGNMSVWSACYVTRDSTYQYLEASTIPFPSPFRPAKHPCVYLPVNTTDRQEGGLYIFSAAADLIRSIPNVTTSIHSSKQVVSWDGRTNEGSLAPTGVYFYVIELPGSTVKGKIPLVRE